MGQLELRDVKKRFGRVEVIKGVSLDVIDGEFVVFVGPSGCGKSTLLRMIAGLEEISAGEVHISGRRVNNLPPVQRGISMVFQSYALYPHMSVFENIAFPLRVEKRPQAEVESKVNRAADILKLRPRLHHRPGELSGGQRQRVAIGRAIVREPSVFLFDEPLSNLDAALRAEMRVELRKLHGNLGATMVFVTHDQVEAMTMADRIVVLNDGVIEQVGSPLVLYHKPANTFVATFIGNPKMNLISVAATSVADKGITVRLPGGDEITVPVDPGGIESGEQLTLGIRPEHCHVEGAGARLEITPQVIERLGIHTVIYAARGDGSAEFCCIVPGAAPIREGQAHPIVIDPADCHLFRADGDAMTRRVELSDLDESSIALPGMVR